MYREKAQTSGILATGFETNGSDFDREFSAYVQTKAKPLSDALKTETNAAASMSKDEVMRQLATQDTFALRLRAGDLMAADGDTTGASVTVQTGNRALSILYRPG